MDVPSSSLVKAFPCLCVCVNPKKEANQCWSNLFDIRFRWKLESPGSPLHCVGFYSWQVGQALTVRMTLMSAFHSPATRGCVFRTIQAMATPVSVVLDLWWGPLPYYYCCFFSPSLVSLHFSRTSPPLFSQVSLIYPRYKAERRPCFRLIIHFIEIKVCNDGQNL